MFLNFFLVPSFIIYFQRFLGSSGLHAQCAFLLIYFQDSNEEMHSCKVLNVSGKFIHGEFSKTEVL